MLCVASNDLLLDMAAAMKASVAALGPLNLAVVDLFQVPITLGPAVPLATYVAGIATYAGYAQGAITWGPPTLALDGHYEILGTVPAWRPSNSVTPNVIYGFYVSNAGGTKVYLAGLFDGGPLPMNSALDQITLTLRYRPADQSAGAQID
jgi:hypothetical protein